MKLRYLANLALIVMPTLVLTWAVSAQGYSSPPDLAPTATNATPLDVVLVIDASVSQAYDPPSMAAYAGRPDLGCDPQGLGVIGLDNGMYANACIQACNNSLTCYPFETVKGAAKAFIDRLRPGYDRVAVISIDRQPRIEFSLDFDLNAAKTAITNMRVSDHSPGGNPGDPCATIFIGGERWKCTTNNLGRALWEAGAQFSTPPFRNDSRRVVITLASSAADSTDGHPSADPDTALFGFCPGKDAQPFCRDNRFATRHVISDTLYDAEDYALDKADALATWPITNATHPGTQLFTIGFGRKTVCTGGADLYNPGPPVVCVPYAGSPYVDPDTGYPNGGEQFLRYVAAVGDDGNAATDPCTGAPLGAQCGNYYFVPQGNGLAETYLHIANRLFGSPDFSAAPLTGPAPLTVNFTDQSLGEVLSRTWDFGDTLTSTTLNPTHTYIFPGAYTVTLQISTAMTVSTLTRTNYITVFAPVTLNARPLDVVLIIDASVSQAYDSPSMAAYADRPDLGCDPQGLGAIGLDPSLYTNACVKACNDDPTKPCYPFKTVKDAAKAFIDRLRPGYDRVAVISIDRQPQVEFSLGFDLHAAKTAIANMRVSDHTIGSPGDPCPTINVSGERWKCTTSNIGGAIRLATGQLTASTAARTMILLGSGGADATDPVASADPDSELFGFCPNKDAQPFCRDNQWATHHVITSTEYDATDYAFDQVNVISSMPGVRLYSLGLGRKVVCTGGYYEYNPGPPVVCVPEPGSPYVDPDTGYPNGAELFLRYAAAVGDDGSAATDPCVGAPLGAQCGNYYFAPDASAAGIDIQRIADRLFGNPDFYAAPLSGPAPLTVTFTDQSLGDVLSHTWNFGDAITSTETNPTHTYTLPGAYTVTLQISTALDVSVLTRTNYITVYTPVAADFNATPITGLLPLTVTFTNLSTGDYTDLLWDFGDSVTSTLDHPTHTYATAGSYRVTLTANGSGGTSTLSRTNYITVYTPVAAGFNATPITGWLPLTVTFTNQSIGDYTDLFWDFGDSVTSTLDHPTHTYTTAGSYTVTLTANGPGGTSTLSRPNYITAYTSVSADFNAVPISGVYPLTVTFSNLSIGNYDTSLWDFGDGVTTTATNPTHTYTSRGVFSVTLTVRGPGGVSALTATNYITTYQPVHAAFIAQPISGTRPLTVNFTNQSTGDYAAVLWNFGDGLTSTVINPTHTYSLTGTYTVTLYITGPGGTASLSRPDFISVQTPEWKFYLPLLMR